MEGVGTTLEGLYSQEKIDNTIAGTDPVYYPCTDWQEALLKKVTTNQRANVSIRGRGRKLLRNTMFLPPLVMIVVCSKVDKRNNFNNNINNNSYSLRSNVNINVTKTTRTCCTLEWYL